MHKQYELRITALKQTLRGPMRHTVIFHMSAESDEAAADNTDRIVEDLNKAGITILTAHTSPLILV